MSKLVTKEDLERERQYCGHATAACFPKCSGRAHGLIKHRRGLCTVCAQLLHNHPLSLYMNLYKRERDNKVRTSEAGSWKCLRVRMGKGHWKPTLVILVLLVSTYAEGNHACLSSGHFPEMPMGYSNMCSQIREPYWLWLDVLSFFCLTDTQNNRSLRCALWLIYFTPHLLNFCFCFIMHPCAFYPQWKHWVTHLDFRHGSFASRLTTLPRCCNR